MNTIEVYWLNKVYRMPYREMGSVDSSKVSSIKLMQPLALLSRHPDGFIRQRAIERLLELFPEQSVPYVVQLASEYVVEIALSIQENLPLGYQGLIREFLNDNPYYTVQLRSRVASYWDCYYRTRYQNLKQYPSYQLLFT